MKKLFSINNENDRKMINKYFLFSRINIVLIFLIIHIIGQASIDNFFYNFDSEHYMNIATRGYKYMAEAAFFPLFPIVCRGLLALINHPIIVILFNNTITYFIGIAIYNLSKEFYSDNINISRYSAKFWYLSPISIYTAVPYTESLFCLLSVMVLYLYKTKGNFTLNGVLLGLLVCTRSTGSLMFFTLFAILFIDFLKSIKTNNSINKFINILKMYTPATIISCLYPFYLQLRLGNWKYFVDVQYDYWWKEKSNIFIVIFREIAMFNSSEFSNYNISLKIETILQSLFAFLVLILCIYAIVSTIKNKKFNVRKELLIYLVLTIYVCYSVNRNWGSPSTSYFRYLLASISIYLMIDNEKVFKTIILISMSMSLIVTASYLLFMFLF